MILSPSILAADFGHMKEELDHIKKAGASYVHIDVMDGHMVPNISMGIPVIKSLRAHSDLVFDVHLMIENPAKYAVDFLDAGADILTFHYEALQEKEIQPLIGLIKSRGKKAGISIKPGTDFKVLEKLLPFLDVILIMTVEPGFGGQKLLSTALDKVSLARGIRAKKNLAYLIEVDGGITLENLSLVKGKGADVVVVGSAIFQRGETFRLATSFVEKIASFSAREI